MNKMNLKCLLLTNGGMALAEAERYKENAQTFLSYTMLVGMGFGLTNMQQMQNVTFNRFNDSKGEWIQVTYKQK